MKASEISRLAMLQVLIIVSGLLCLGITMKMKGYNSPYFTWQNWNPVSVFLRHNTLVVLLVPFLWTLYAVAAAKRENEWWNPRYAQISAFLLLAVIVALYGYGSLFA